MIKPHFESITLCTCRSTTQIERLQKLQNKDMRSILKYDRYTPVQLMLDSLQFIKKMKVGKGAAYLTEQLGYVRDNQPYHPRNTGDFRLPMATTTSMQR